MSLVREVFQVVKSQGRAALISYLPVGVPTLEHTLDLVHAADHAGTDIFELGIPFTDALADGKLVQEASRVALRNRVTVRECLDLVGELRSRGVQKPILAMSYLNPLSAYGLERLSEDAKCAGLNGFIIPDLSLDQVQPWRETVERAGLVTISFLASTTTDERIRTIASQANGFLYCLAATGVTGARKDLAPGLQQFISRIRQATDIPLAVGFGISSPAQVNRVSQWSDGVVVGSVLVETIMRSSPDRICTDLANIVSEMANATRLIVDPQSVEP